MHIEFTINQWWLIIPGLIALGIFIGWWISDGEEE